MGIFELSGYRRSLSVSFNPAVAIELPVTAVNLPVSPTKCSLPFLRQFALSHHDYPTMSFNTVNKSLTDKQLQQLSTSASCWFPSQFDKRDVSTAWSNKNIQRILILGDSNGGRYFDAVIRIMRNASWSCTTVRREKLGARTYPDASYFVREPFIKLEHIRVQLRDCWSCLSTLSFCNTSDEKSDMRELWIEYIALEFTMDAEVTTHRTLWNGSCKHGQMCEHSTSYQEFIFKEYLHGQYPDVMFYFASCHDIVRHKMRHLRHNFDFLFGMMHIYLPLTTTAIYMNLHNQRLSLAPMEWQVARYEDGTLNINEVIIRQNNIMYQSLEKYLLSSERQWYAFPSLYDSTNATDNLYMDNAHKTSVWYDHVIGNLLYLLFT